MASGVLMLGQTRSAVSKPYDYQGGGHYRTTAQFAIVNSQAANSRLFVIRNSSSANSSSVSQIIITRLTLQFLQTGAHTAAIEDSFDVYKLTGFTVLDTTNTQTPTTELMQTSRMTAVGSSIAQVRAVSAAGNANGMTGGTSTKGGRLTQLPIWFLAAQPTGGPVPYAAAESGDRSGEHPLVLETGEGLLVENRVVLGAAAAASGYIDISWVEAPFGASF